MAAKANLTLDQGTDWSTSINILDDSGTPFNFTGYTGKSEFRKHFESENSVEMLVTFSPGFLNLSLNAASTQAVSPGRYMYDVELTNTSTSKVTRIIEGIITVNGEVTKI